MNEVQRRVETLREKVKQTLLKAHRAGDLSRLSEEMNEVQRRVETFSGLKRRVMSSLLKAARRGELSQLVANDVDADGDRDDVLSQTSRAEAEIKAVGCRLSSSLEKAKNGILGAHRRGDLQNMAAELDNLADTLGSQAAKLGISIKTRAAHGLLTALRSGELEKIAGELDELDDAYMPLPELSPEPTVE